MNNNSKEKNRCLSDSCLKYSLCMYNFVFLLSGCVICGLGLWTILEKWVFVQLMPSVTYEVTIWLLVATGCVCVVTSLLGYTGLAFESRPILACYTILLVAILMFESVLVMLAYVYQGQMDIDLQRNLADTFILGYSDQNPDTIQAVDKIQTKYSCCGVSSYVDWSESTWHKNHPLMKVPDSCCKTVTDGCGARDHPSNIDYTGCIHRFSTELDLHLLMLGCTSLGTALLQVFGIIITSCVFSRLRKKDKYSQVGSNGSRI